jgi:DNA-binding CsgD family transcriptional regulator
VFYFMIVLLIAALMSSAAAFMLLVLQWRRSRDFFSLTAIKITLCLVLVLVVNFIGFIVESAIPRPDPRILFLLMSIANLALSVSSWQIIDFTSALIGAGRSARVDAACLIGIAAVYIVSVYFALFHKIDAGMRYDNHVGFMIPSISSALVGSACALASLRFSPRIPERWRSFARFSCFAFLGISLLSVANETLPLARLLGLAQFPLSPFLMIAMSGMIIAIVWRSLNESRSGAARIVPSPQSAMGLSESPGGLFDERIIVEASRLLAERFGLSIREREIAALVLAGKPNTAIAERLYISVFTVKNHIHSVFRKTGAENRIDLMRIASISTISLPGRS